MADKVTLEHPKLEGQTFTCSRKQYEDVWADRGWVEVEEKPAKKGRSKKTAEPVEKENE